jgi:hypothetical protein
MDTQCKATSKSGAPCSAQPVRASGYCYWHDAELEHERQANRRRGGQARSNQARARRRYQKEQLSLNEVNGLLAVALKGVISGQMEPGVGSATAALARAIKDMTLATELEQRLQALEAQAAHQKGRSA